MARRQRGGMELSRPFKIYLLAVALIALLAVILLLLFYPRGKAAGAEAGPTASSAESFPYHRIKLPPEKLELVSLDPLQVRTRRSAWSGEDVERFWIPPEPLIEELLLKENRTILKEIFDDLP
jgi:hypothetical protein